MWELKERIRRLLETTGMTTGRLAELMRSQGDATVRGSMIRRELASEEPPTALWQGRLLRMAELLTKAQERQNERVLDALSRADEALSKVK